MSIIKRNILFIDDDPHTRVLLQAILKQAGYLPITASDGFEAIDLIHKHAFDLIILDVMMPQMNGFDFLKRIKSSEKSRDVPVVMLTTKDDRPTIEKAMALGAADYIVKPPEKSIVCKKIERILGGRPRFAEVIFSETDSQAASEVEITHKARLLSVGENGLVIKSPIPIVRMSDQEFDFPLFRQLAIDSTRLDIISSVEDKTGQYIIYFSYLDLSEKDVEKLRSWVITQKLRPS